jgi:hypothetical protein
VAQSREEKTYNKMSDLFADERLNVVQLGYLSALGFTPTMMSRIKGWIHWHDQISESVHIRDDGSMSFIDGEYLEYIRRNEIPKK